LFSFSKTIRAVGEATKLATDFDSAFQSMQFLLLGNV
jgi:hypothetical protein